VKVGGSALAVYKRLSYANDLDLQEQDLHDCSMYALLPGMTPHKNKRCGCA
jgi:hypothetical protein